MTKLLLLPISKRDQPADANAAAALALVPKALASAPPLKTKGAATQFWESLVAYGSRNLAELSGSRSTKTNGAEKPAAIAKNGTGDKPKRVHSAKRRPPMAAEKTQSATA